jgi:hypothetical protein
VKEAMAREFARIERLNLAAKVLVDQRPGSLWRSVYFTWFPLMLPTFVETLFHKHWLGYLLAGLAAATTVAIFCSARYGFLAAALVQVASAMGLVLLTVPSLAHIVSVSAAYLIAASLLCSAVDSLEKGRRMMLAQSDGWESARAQVGQWLDHLRGKGKKGDVIEIGEHTFRFGDVTYRLLKADNCWALATFRRGREHRFPLNYSVVDLNSVSIDAELGAVHAKVDGQTIPRGRATAAAVRPNTIGA